MAGIRLGTEDLVFKLGNSDCKVYIGDTLLYQPYSPSGQTPCFEVVEALSGASGDYVDVYNTSDSKWYKKNNLSQYEEYGIRPEADSLSGLTYYVGKLAVNTTDNHEYKHNGTDWVDIGEVVTSGTSEYFLAASTSSEKAYYYPGYYFGEGYHVEFDVYFTTYNNLTLLGPGNPQISPIEFVTYQYGFYNDFHAPQSTSNNSCYSGDYSQRNITTSMGISQLNNRRFRIRVGVCDVYWYDYETGTELFRSVPIYTGYNWYNGLYFGEIRCSSAYTFRYKGFKVYDANENLVNDIEARYRPGTTANKQIYFHDNVLNVDYENVTENPVGYYEEQGEQVTVYPEEYDTKVAPPDNVSYNTLAELELMECPWVGMHATVGGVPYIYTANGWEVEQVYTQYDYVQGNGTSYIKTDYVPVTDTRYECDMQGRLSPSSTSTEGECSWLGGIESRGTSASRTNRFRVLYSGNPPGMRCDYSNAEAISQDSRIITRGVIKLDKTGGYFNDDKLVTFRKPQAISNAKCHCGIFGSLEYNLSTNVESVSQLIYAGKIYSLKIYEGETLVRNFVPAEKDGVCGMYETITGTMYGSENSTPFTVGNE